MTKTGAGTLTLSGANSYAGPTVVDQGILRAGSSSAFGTGSFLTVRGGAMADFNGFSQTFYSVSGTGGVGLNGGAALTVGGDNSSSALDATLSGSGRLVKTGTGTLTLTGTNTFTGGVSLDAGALSISSDANLGGNGALTMAGGTAMNITATGLFTHNLLLGGGQRIVKWIHL